MICNQPSALRPENGSIVVSTEHNNEYRELVVAQPSHDVLVAYEFTAGSLTAEVFQTPWREHRVSLDPADAAFVLGPCSKGVLAGLVAFIQPRQRSLSELMDLLDDALVRYRYDYQANGEPLLTRMSTAFDIA